VTSDYDDCYAERREADRVEFRDYVRVLRKGWVYIVVFTLVGIAAAAAFTIVQTPVYQATAKVFVSVQSTGTVSDLTQGGSFAQGQVKSYADVATSSLVLQPVINELKLTTTVGELATRVSATSPQGTVVMDISVSDTAPDSAAAIANAVASTFEDTVSTLVPLAADGTAPVKITILQQAVAPSFPSSPNVALNIIFGGLVGLIAGIAAAVLREVLDTRVRNEHDVHSIVNSPVLGGIQFDPMTPEHPLVVRDDPRGPRAEAFRTLRTNLQFVAIGEGHRSFVLTSSVPGEGKSTTSANLAIAMALSGQQVLIVDADLRKPRVAEYLGLEGAAGLTDVLVGRAQPGEVIQRWGETNLYVLPAGKIPPNPSELLGSTKMESLVASLEKSFDVVIFDAPPLLPVTDAAILATRTSGALLMVAAGRVHKNQVRGALSALSNVSAHVAGIVITMLPTKGPDSYGYSYGYGYGYGYGDAELGESPKKATK